MRRVPSPSAANASFALSANVKRQAVSSFLSAEATESFFSPTVTVKDSGVMLFLNVSSVSLTVTAALLPAFSITVSAFGCATRIETEYGNASFSAASSSAFAAFSSSVKFSCSGAFSSTTASAANAIKPEFSSAAHAPSAATLTSVSLLRSTVRSVISANAPPSFTCSAETVSANFIPFRVTVVSIPRASFATEDTSL